MESKAGVRDERWEMSLEFSLDLAVCLYPTGSGEQLKGKSSDLTTAVITLIISQEQHWISPLQSAKCFLLTEIWL